MTASRIVEVDGVRFVEVVEAGDAGARLYRILGDQVAAGGTGVTFTGEQTGRLKPMPEPGPDGWLVGAELPPPSEPAG